MPAEWYEMWRTAKGATPGEAVALYVREFWDAERRWVWADAAAGLFTVAHGISLYRVRRDKAGGGAWVFEWCNPR